jgi:aerobic carbon-monoxide dehydrogenase large subunit
VNVIDRNRSHWVARAPAGTTVEWDATIIEDEPNKKISWRSLPESSVDHSGSVLFRHLPARNLTEVKIIMSYRPPLGPAGQAVAIVVGSDKYGVRDAAEQVFVEYESLPVVVDPEKALEAGSPLVHEEIGTNQTHEWTIGGGDMDAAWAESDVVIERRIVNHRTAGAPIEPRAALAEWHGDRVTLWTTTQIPHILRLQLAVMLGIAEDRLRVVAPDVGGGFGTKLNVYGEEALLVWLTRKLNRPVKWTETRSEHMATTIHGRDQIEYVKLGAKSDGTLTAIHARVLQDCGAYFQLLTPYIPCFTAFVMSGCYAIPNVKTDITGVFTNKFATDATRGAGRPEATHLIEVMMDQLAAELDMDRLELRRKNFIKKEDFPAEVALGVVYDSGDYEGTLDKLLGHVNVEEFRREQGELRERGIYRGIGFSTYVEICGLAPSRAVGPQTLGLQASFDRERYTFSVEAENFTGTERRDQFSNPLPGRVFRAKARVTIL